MPDPYTEGVVTAAALGSGGNIPIPGGEGGAWGTLTDETGIGLLMMPIPDVLETGATTAGLVVVAGGGNTRKAEALLLLVADELWRASSSLKNL